MNATIPTDLTGSLTHQTASVVEYAVEQHGHPNTWAAALADKIYEQVPHLFDDAGDLRSACAYVAERRAAVEGGQVDAFGPGA